MSSMTCVSACLTEMARRESTVMESFERFLELGKRAIFMGLRNGFHSF